MKREDPAIQSWEDLQTAVNDASSQSENVTLTLGSGIYKNTGTIIWSKTGIVLPLMEMDRQLMETNYEHSGFIRVLL